MTLRLDRFGQDALAEYVRGTGRSNEVALQMAVRYYLADAGSDRAAWRLPDLAREAVFTRTLEIELDEDLHAELEREARRQDAQPDLLATHAILYFLGDLESGRVAARLGDAMNRDAEAK